MAKKFLAAMAAASAALPASAQLFGAADNYNTFVFKDFKGYSSDVEGKLAVGGNLTLENYDLGLLNPGGATTVVGGNVTWKNGTNRGDLYRNGSTSLTNVAMANGGALKTGSPFSFGDAKTYLMDVSSMWKSLQATGQSYNRYGGLRLEGSNSNLNIFKINKADLRGIWGVEIQVPEGASVLINVEGEGILDLPNVGYSYNGSQDKGKMVNVAWHMPDISNINMSYLGGTMFAPRADVKGTWGVINGQLIANSWDGPTQQNWARYKGADQLRLETGAVPEPGTMIAAAIGGAALLRRRQQKAKAKARAEA
jgi:choice-of-anchor A domain-containing protein